MARQNNKDYWYIGSFADTAGEWHYLAGGACLGFSVGLVMGAYHLRPLERE